MLKKDGQMIFSNEIFENTEDDGDLVTPKEMKENIGLIKAQIPNFKKRFSEISKVKLKVSNIDIDRIIRASVEEENLNDEEKRIMNGFYETWMAIFDMVGSDREALEIVFKMMNSVE